MINGDASLAALYGVEQDQANRALATRYAPIIRHDDNEPFRPLTAGYTIFHKDGGSPSFNRQIRLRSRKCKADQVIEYAIWWDWDINHLYELEHVWVYLDRDGQVIRVEGSWHGAVRDLATNGRLAVEDTHPVVNAAPGKHAFAPKIEDFKMRQAKVPGMTTRFAGAMGIAVNGLFKGEIQRSPPVDRLIHSYLTRFAFEPSWNFSQAFTFNQEMLVPWPALRRWIPQRVKGWIGILRQEIGPEHYRTLRTVRCSSMEDIHKAGQMRMDMVSLDIGASRWGLPVLMNTAGRPTGANLVRLLQACERARIGAYLVIHDKRIIPWVARLLGRKDWTDYLMTGASVPEWVASIKSRLPQYRTTLIMETPPADVAAAAQSVGASYVHVTAPSISWLTTEWIKSIRQAEVGIVLTATDSSELTWQRSVGVEAIMVDDPAVFGVESLSEIGSCLT
jgi:hypothetical protein